MIYHQNVLQEKTGAEVLRTAVSCSQEEEEDGRGEYEWETAAEVPTHCEIEGRLRLGIRIFSWNLEQILL